MVPKNSKLSLNWNEKNSKLSWIKKNSKLPVKKKKHNGNFIFLWRNGKRQDLNLRPSILSVKVLATK